MNALQTGMRTAAAMGGLLVSLAMPAISHGVEIIDDPLQIDERAAQIVATSNSLCWEMYRYHRQQPNYNEAYRTAKDLWSLGVGLRDALRAGPLENDALAQQTARINELTDRVEKLMAPWGDGDRSVLPMNAGVSTRTVMTPGVSVDIPFIGVQVGSPRLAVVEDGPPLLERRRLHPNSRGSRRSLEREFAALRTAVAFLNEDAGVSVAAPGGSTPISPAPAGTTPSGNGPVPQPPDAGPVLGDPVKIVPPAAGKPGNTPVRK
jgi:hypothetical protein